MKSKTNKVKKRSKRSKRGGRGMSAIEEKDMQDWLIRRRNQANARVANRNLMPSLKKISLGQSLLDCHMCRSQLPSCRKEKKRLNEQIRRIMNNKKTCERNQYLALKTIKETSNRSSAPPTTIPSTSSPRSSATISSSPRSSRKLRSSPRSSTTTSSSPRSSRDSTSSPKKKYTPPDISGRESVVEIAKKGHRDYMKKLKEDYPSPLPE